MTQLLDKAEYQRWLDQAKHNLASAEKDAQDGHFAWACFKAQQAAEMAAKAFLIALGQPALGHGITALLRKVESLGIAVPQELIWSAQRLDRLYIATRCPNAHPSGALLNSLIGRIRLKH